jgi:glycosyltransferase involved in cell wall biosynthesis
MNNPFFSIIIPTYNRAQMLPKAIKSVLAQTFTNWELIIVDDGSSDRTKEIVLRYKDERIKYIYQENQERSAARNNGIQNSKGIYICFLDSDDYFLPERLELLKLEINNLQEPIAMLFTSICFEIESKINERKQLELIKYSNRYDYIIMAVIGAPQVCIHKSIINAYRFNTKIRIGEDIELWLRIVDNYPLLFVSGQPTIVATCHDDRSVNEEKYNSFAEMLEVLKIIFAKNHPGHKATSKVKRNIKCGVFFGIARFYIYNNIRSKALYYLLRSLFIMPESPKSNHAIFLLYKVFITKKNELCKLKRIIR